MMILLIRQIKEGVWIQYLFEYQKLYSDPINEKVMEVLQISARIIGTSMALCLGDMGFYLALQVIAQNYKDNENLGRVLEYYNSVWQLRLVKGKWSMLFCRFMRNFMAARDDLENHVMEIYKLKTAWYSVVGPYCLGAILGG